MRPVLTAKVCPLFLGILLGCFPLLRSARSALPTDHAPEAKMRAEIYQAEAVKEFSDHHWAVARNRPGEFVAVHNLYDDKGPIFAWYVNGRRSEDRHEDPRGTPVAYATVRFRPDTAQHTHCTIHSVGYLTRINESTGKREVSKPYEINNQENKRFMEGLMKSAEKNLVRHHPEYARR